MTKEQFDAAVAAQQNIQKRNSPTTKAWQDAYAEIERLVCLFYGLTKEQYELAGRKQ